MKTLICTLFTTVLLFLSASLQSNPIPPPSLIVEVYFEDGEWVLVVDNMYMWAYGLENFEDVEIFSSSGFSYVNPDVVPNPEDWVTLLTVDDLTQSLEIDPVEDHVGAWVWGGYILCDLEWGPDPDDIVSGPEPWQSIVISYVAASPDWDYIFWPLKGASHNCYVTGCSKKGVFTGIVTDQYGTPIQSAEICYLPDGLLFSDYGFSHIITDTSGHYSHNYMHARNYHIEKIMFDDAEYPVNEYISIEPNGILNLDFTIYTTQTEKPVLNNETIISNFPNPCKESTTFIINLQKNIASEVSLEICDITGKVMAYLEADPKIREQSIYWNPGTSLQPGQYLVLLKTGQEILASHKIIVQ